jgi:hypothetical protein
VTILHDRFPCFIFRGICPFLSLFGLILDIGFPGFFGEHLKRVCGILAFSFIGLCAIKLRSSVKRIDLSLCRPIVSD